MDSGFRGNDLAMREKRGHWASARLWASPGEMCDRAHLT